MNPAAFPPAPWDTPTGKVTVSLTDLARGWLEIRKAKIVSVRWVRGVLTAVVEPQEEDRREDHVLAETL